MANIALRDPFNDLVDDFFKGFFVRPAVYGNAPQGGYAAARVKVDVSEKNGAYLVNAELPGVRKEDIQVQIDGAQVTLSAEVKREKDTKDAEERVLYTERSYGKLSRSFTLPEELDEAKAEAKFREGVLQLTLPKKAAPERKAITVQ
jgi:HSP20 family protein